jgi:hypothetical protein
LPSGPRKQIPPSFFEQTQLPLFVDFGQRPGSSNPACTSRFRSDHLAELGPKPKTKIPGPLTGMHARDPNADPSPEALAAARHGPALPLHAACHPHPPPHAAGVTANLFGRLASYGVAASTSASRPGAVVSVEVPVCPLSADSVAKLAEERLAGASAQENRIGTSKFWNQQCAQGHDLESMLLARMLKIVLQHYLPQADN